MEQYRLIFGIMAIFAMLTIAFGYILMRVNSMIDGRLETVDKTGEHSIDQAWNESKDTQSRQTSVGSHSCDL